MLANNLTLDDEEAVQEEFKELQALEEVSLPTNRHCGISFDASLGSQDWTKERFQAPRCSKHRTRPCRDSRYCITSPPHTRDPWLTTRPEPQVEEPARERVPVLA